MLDYNRVKVNNVIPLAFVVLGARKSRPFVEGHVFAAEREEST